ncbi:MAG: TlpA family protein disulfide reductase [Chitinophagaceae bacterium]|nr:TlpA family protein disulfide reductase [Chitinophagaceae bacterium]
MYRIHFFLVFLNIKSFSQTNYFIKVTDNQNIFDSLFISEAYFIKEYKNAILYQTDVLREKNSFYFKGSIEYPTAFRIWGHKGNYKFNELIFVDSGYQSFEISLINNKINIIAESPTITNIQKEHKNLLEYLGVSNFEDSNVYSSLKEYVKHNPQSYIALYLMIDKVFFNGFNEFWRVVSTDFDDQIKATKAYKYFSSQYLVGKKINPLVVINSNGEKIKKQFKPESNKKNLVILLWFANCGPCISEMQQINKKFPFKNYEIVSVCTDSFTKTSKASKILKKNKIQWPNYWDQRGEKFSEYIKLYSYPFNIVIDTARNIIGKHFDVKTFL